MRKNIYGKEVEIVVWVKKKLKQLLFSSRNKLTCIHRTRLLLFMNCKYSKLCRDLVIFDDLRISDQGATLLHTEVK